MKKPQPDLESLIVGNYIRSVGDNRKLKRLWGTTVVDGVKVLNSRRHYHKKANRPENFDSLFRFLGLYSDVKDYEGEGVKSAWVTLNKSKGPEPTEVAPSFVSDNLNLAWWDDNDGVRPTNLTLTTSIVIGESFATRSGMSAIDWSLPKEDIIQFVIDNYESLWSSNHIKQEGVGVINKGSFIDPKLKIEVQDEDDLSPDDPWLAILSRYALRDNGIPCTIKNVEVGLDAGDPSYSVTRVYNTAVVTLEIPYKEFLFDDPIVTRIVDDISSINFPFTAAMQDVNIRNGANNAEFSSNEHVTQSLIKTPVFYETVEDIDVTTVTRPYGSYEEARLTPSIFENLWLKGTDGVYYLKAEVIDDPRKYSFKHNTLSAYLSSILDTGYKKKKVSVWKKIVAAVIFIIATILAFVPGAQGLSAVLYEVAAAILVGAIVIAILGALASALGDADWAGAFASVSKTVAPLVTVASIVLILTGSATIMEGIQQYTVNELVDFGFEKIFAEFGDLGRLIYEAATGQLDSDTVDILNRMLGVYTSVQLAKIETINSKNKDLKAEYDELSKEMAQETAAMSGFMNIYAKPATADWSIYASTFDLPYERGGGIMAMGNIQRTTKQAMRKADYKEPSFDGIMLV